MESGVAVVRQPHDGFAPDRLWTMGTAMRRPEAELVSELLAKLGERVMFLASMIMQLHK